MVILSHCIGYDAGAAACLVINVGGNYQRMDNIATIFFVAAAIAAGWESFKTHSVGWGGVCLMAIGLALTTI